MMINKVTPFVDLFNSFDTTSMNIEQTNQELMKIKEHVYETLGTSIIKGTMSPPSLQF